MFNKIILWGRRLGSRLLDQWPLLSTLVFLSSVATLVLNFNRRDLFWSAFACSAVALLVTVFLSWRSWVQVSNSEIDADNRRWWWPAIAVVLSFYILSVAMLMALSTDQGLAKVEALNSKHKVLAPSICVNRMPTEGVAGPYPEILKLGESTVTSIGVCNNLPQSSYGFKVRQLRVQKLSEDGKWDKVVSFSGSEGVFTPPLELQPGDKLYVDLVGIEGEFYKQNFTLHYQAVRRLKTY